MTHIVNEICAKITPNLLDIKRTITKAMAQGLYNDQGCANTTWMVMEDDFGLSELGQTQILI